MTDKEMLDSLQKIFENINFDRDRKTYSKMLVLLEDMYHILRYDLLIDYPIEYNKYPIIKEGSFDF